MIGSGDGGLVRKGLGFLFFLVSDGYDHDVCRCVRVGGIDTLGFFSTPRLGRNRFK